MSAANNLHNNVSSPTFDKASERPPSGTGNSPNASVGSITREDPVPDDRARDADADAIAAANAAYKASKLKRTAAQAKEAAAAAAQGPEAPDAGGGSSGSDSSDNDAKRAKKKAKRALRKLRKSKGLDRDADSGSSSEEELDAGFLACYSILLAAVLFGSPRQLSSLKN